jgi:hypothetical protein
MLYGTVTNAGYGGAGKEQVMTSNSAPGRILAAVIALVATAALHGGWLTGMDRDAVAAASTLSA